MPSHIDLMPNEKIIDTDSIDFSEAHPDTRTPEGMSRGLELFRRPFEFGAAPGLAAATEDTIPLIPRSEWQARIEEKLKLGTNLSQIMRRAKLPCKNQKQTNFCWMFATTGAVEVIRLIQGEPYVSLSPSSVANIVKNGWNSGGYGGEALEGIIKYGLAPTDLYPDARVGQTIQSSEITEARKLYSVQEWAEVKPKNLDYLVSALLANKPISAGLNWWGHQVLFLDALWDGEIVIRFRNSWGSSYGDDGYNILRGSKMMPDEAVTPLSANPGVTVAPSSSIPVLAL